MESETDVLVIGGGVIGVCSAYYLARQGVRVMLIEKDEIASGCSWGNGGLIVPSHSVPLASPGALGNGLRWLFNDASPFYIKPRLDLNFIKWLIGFAWASRKSTMLKSLPVLRDLLFASRALFEELAQEFDAGFDGQGALQVFSTQKSFEEGIHEARLMERFEIPIQVLKHDETLAMEPALLPNLAGSVFFPQDGRVDPARFVLGLAEKAQALGVQIWAKTEALRFEVSNGRLSAVHTTRGVIQPKQVVLAAGSWSPQVAKSLRLAVPIQAAKGYSVTLTNPTLSPRLPLLLADAHVVVNPLGHALRIAGTLELAGMDFSYHPARLQAVRDAARGFLRGVEEVELIEAWRGLRPCTPDGLPIIGRAPQIQNLVVAAGHAMLGVSLGPVTGKLVAQIATEGQTLVDVEALRLERF